MHLLLGTQRLLDLNATNVEMATSRIDAENYGPSIKDNLELRSGGGCEYWADGGKAEEAYRLRRGPQRDFSKILSVHKV